MNFVHQNFKVNENFYRANKENLSYFNTALSNSAEPGNSNNISLAYSNTPINACFFMRSTNTPKERLKMACSSMVACYGKGFALCCVPVIAVFQPVTRYRPSLETFAVTSKNLFTGVTAMLYLFKAVSRSDLRNTRKLISSFPRYTVRINAESIEQATAQIAPFFVILEVRNA
ncbi:ash family protein [Avibacterium gallinarum]|uniref:ash family protein n=1 Tax=Avibacterium gallinarum TaxID=755 RepID=UPI003BF8FEA5